jgi:hypothetical protein
MLGGEGWIDESIDLSQRIVRVYVPEANRAETMARLEQILGHRNFEVLSIEGARAGLQGTGDAARTADATLDGLGQLQKQVDDILGFYQKQVVEAASKRLASDLGLDPTKGAAVLTHLDESAVRGLHGALGNKGIEALAGKDPALLDNIARVYRVSQGDSVALGELTEALRLNSLGKGGVSNAALDAALKDYLAFRAEFGNRVTGDFLARFVRMRTNEPAQAAAELAMARDLLSGRSAFGSVDGVAGLEDGVNSLKTPDLRALTPDGARLVEVKTIGQQGGTPVELSENMIRNALSKAKSQIKTQVAQSGEVDGLIRLDGRGAPPSTLTPGDFERMLRGELVNSTNVRYVEVLYNDAQGGVVKVTMEVVAGRLQIRSVGAP